ncbi:MULTISPECIES: TetR/AcrR family transcriptional regulator [Gordonibacter]|uniref:TetR/AcrR family transcriptional regulator n=1 Tax=Gordonibacter faecis TaxID=3047475 RepID=A0ABT7DMU1_9ACTN|nr:MULTISPECIES: TetR/AcrR family transcriptional regulator [unclassified Gordonibacter]MDJ1649490.1 TetR/AcrR family transcriptional regulator [Gordonibacter sp. KGMB12511]HIW76354.1 TetR/AcrR family transcriptional regulator [Candidatus Gordonibacter avicola]
MSANDAIERSFKKLLETTSYEKITVSAICEDAGVSRKTFYVRYRDKEAIVESLFDQHVMQPLRNLNELLSRDSARKLDSLFYEKMYESLFDERTYYENLVGPLRGHDDTFIRVVTNAIYAFNKDLIPKIGYRGSTVTADYIAYFFASSQAMFMQKWISDKMVLSPHELAELYGKMTSSFWRDLA